MKRLISQAPRPGLTGLLIVFSLILAACSSPAAANPPSEVLPVTGGATVGSADNPEFGPILVTPDGKTLYSNTVDTADETHCTNIACTGFWPPFTIEGEPTAGEDLPGELGTIIRPDGSTQVTYNQKPLYTFYLDRQAGDANGEGFTDFGGTWHVVPLEDSPGGEQ